jgi:hypothetical protein
MLAVMTMANPAVKDNVVRTAQGIITREEYEELQKEHPQGIPGSAIEETIRERAGPTPFEVEQQQKAQEQTLASITDLSRLTPEQYEAYQALPDREKFDIAVRTGAIPKGSEFVPKRKITYTKEALAEAKARGEPIVKGRTWGYLTPEQAAQVEATRALRAEQSKRVEAGRKYFETKAKERQAQHQQLETQLKTYKVDEGYDLVSALNAGIAVQTLKRAGFATEDITKAQKLGESLKAVDRYALKDGTFDVIGAIKAGVDTDHLVNLFGKEVVNTAQG